MKVDIEDGVLLGMNLPLIMECWTNDAGVRIAWLGNHLGDGCISFRYYGKDLKVEFWASSIQNYDHYKTIDELVVLGPVRRIDIWPRSLSRAVSPEEGLDIASNISDAMMNYSQFRRAKPPYPQQVQFSKDAIKARGNARTSSALR
jgi:hypothetical protein